MTWPSSHSLSRQPYKPSLSSLETNNNNKTKMHFKSAGRERETLTALESPATPNKPSQVSVLMLAVPVAVGYSGSDTSVSEVERGRGCWLLKMLPAAVALGLLHLQLLFCCDKATGVCSPSGGDNWVSIPKLSKPPRESQRHLALSRFDTFNLELNFIWDICQTVLKKDLEGLYLVSFEFLELPVKSRLSNHRLHSKSTKSSCPPEGGSVGQDHSHYW